MIAQAPQVGVHYGISFEEYLAWEAVNWSTLKPFDISPKQGRYEMTTPDESTVDTDFGTAFHAAVLEPEKFEAVWAVMPDFPGHHNSNAYKALVAQWEKDNADKVKLMVDEMRRLKGMQAAIRAHPTTRAILDAKGRNEMSIVWRDKETGELCKGRIDRLCRIPAKVLNPTLGGNAIIEADFKKTRAIHRFDNEVAKFGYHAQRAFYADGLATIEQVELTSMLIAVQDEPPYDVIPMTMSGAIESGRKLYRRCLETLIRCRKSDSWPGICPVGAMECDLPKYAIEE